MSEKKPPHEQMTDKNNGLSSAQEVLYQEEYKKADKVAKNEKDSKKQEKEPSAEWFQCLVLFSCFVTAPHHITVANCAADAIAHQCDAGSGNDHKAENECRRWNVYRKE